MLGARTLQRRRPRALGFTLPELLTVVAITGVLAAIAMFSLSGSGNDQNAAALARSIQMAMLRARTEALSDGSARQLRCGPSVSSGTMTAAFAGCSFWVGTAKGANPAGWIEESYNVQASSHALIWNITANPTDVAASAGTLPMTTNWSITFNPSGTVIAGGGTTPTGATVFVCDKTGNHRYKVYVFKGTGLSKLVNTW
jgi:prepilin-type N-terminal cleavage/methylation domain-containing protein